MADDLHELSALYALDALDADDRARFEEHLEDCATCRDELAGLRDASSALAYVPEGPAPPADLRERVLAAVRAEPKDVVPLRPRRSAAVSVAATFAVAATAAAVGFGIWAASLHHSLAQDRAALRVLGDPQARRIPLTGAKGSLVVAPSGVAALAVDLPAPPSGKQYEAWVIDTTAHRAGTFSGHTALLRVHVQPGTTVKVTLERAGGVDAPTTQPLLTARA
jgi:anti-sigma factor RsiW